MNTLTKLNTLKLEGGILEDPAFHFVAAQRVYFCKGVRVIDVATGYSRPLPSVTIVAYAFGNFNEAWIHPAVEDRTRSGVPFIVCRLSAKGARKTKEVHTIHATNVLMVIGEERYEANQLHAVVVLQKQERDLTKISVDYAADGAAASCAGL